MRFSRARILPKERLLLPSTWKADGPWKLWRDSGSTGGGTSNCRGSCACEADGALQRTARKGPRRFIRADGLFVVGVRRWCRCFMVPRCERSDGLDRPGSLLRTSLRTRVTEKPSRRCGELLMAALPDRCAVTASGHGFVSLVMQNVNDRRRCCCYFHRNTHRCFSTNIGDGRHALKERGILNHRIARVELGVRGAGGRECRRGVERA